ncbi:hypothetical protein SAMN04488012_104265 [Palleronia salina]|uniref:Copper(I)-binding protein n=2 Tax=Palleronia salina TaxID=313368 RepID=A0A1M6GAP3_9RHOB|nr:hypothetical protein SAMN04488012_104265 [Palleronia salina]
MFKFMPSAALIGALFCLPAWAQAQDLSFDTPFIIQASPMSGTAGGFIEITNTGETPDRLVAVARDGATVELHESLQDADGVARMEPRPDGFPIAPGETLRLARGGKHIMFVDLDAPFRPGDAVDVTLVFETAGEVPVTFEVSTPSGMGGTTDHGSMGGDAHGDHGMSDK